MSRYQGPTIEIFPGRPVTIRDGARVLEIRTPADAARARELGYDIDIVEPGPPLSRTPAQDHIADPLVVDPRPIRELTEDQRRAWAVFIQRGAWAAVAGFETWRGRDRWLYVDVLGVYPDADAAEEHGLPVGPVDAGWIPKLRMVGDQLALRMADPWGR